MNFIEQLNQIPDHRKSKGKRHQLWLVMCLTLLGVLCNYHGYRSLADFCEKHWETLQKMLELAPESRIPSYSTFRCVIQGEVIALAVSENKHISEIEVVKQVITSF